VPRPQRPGIAVHSLTFVHVPPEPGAVYPQLHEHMYEPAVLVQEPRPAPQEFTGEHSLLSVQPVPDARPSPE
jgi:hypothetical protein